MKVRDLKKLLDEYEGSDDDLIVLSCDPEGNGYSPGGHAEPGHYYEDSSFADYVTAEEAEQDEDINLEGSVPCFTLWPMY